MDAVIDLDALDVLGHGDERTPDIGPVKDAGDEGDGHSVGVKSEPADGDFEDGGDDDAVGGGEASIVM
jgi:hypothetical protein